MLFDEVDCLSQGAVDLNFTFLEHRILVFVGILFLLGSLVINEDGSLFLFGDDPLPGIISGSLERSVEVFFFTSDGTATSIYPLDFNPLTDVVLQFNASTSSIPVIITIVDDGILENSETFFGNLRTSDSGVVVDSQRAIVTILEEAGDGK